MSGLILYYQANTGKKHPIELDVDATCEELLKEVKKVDPTLNGPLKYQGEKVPTDSTLIADTSISNEATIGSWNRDFYVTSINEEYETIIIMRKPWTPDIVFGLQDGREVFGLHDKGVVFNHEDLESAKEYLQSYSLTTDIDESFKYSDNFWESPEWPCGGYINKEGKRVKMWGD